MNHKECNTATGGAVAASRDALIGIRVSGPLYALSVRVSTHGDPR